ncbi:MAG TPA: class I SAM-dependent methyltransferase, partial [Nitrospiria bacterium]
MEKTIIFDQYSRYKVCSDLLLKISPNGGTVLDVGSGEECLLGKFLPNFEITYVDPLLSLRAERSGNKIAGDVFVKDLDGQSFDYVVSVDTLEHIPIDARNAFLVRVSSLSRKGIILACPCSDAGDAVETDRWLNEVYKISRGADFSWLKEHREYGLPKLSETLKKFTELGWRTGVIQNGHTPWLRELLGFILCGLDVPSLQPAIMELSEYFNRYLYPFDHHPPCYRQVVVAEKKRIPPLGMKITGVSKEKAVHAWEHVQKRIHAYSTRVAYLQEAQISEQKLLAVRLREELQQKDETLRV